MSNLVSRLRRGAAKNARFHLQGPRAASSHAFANNNRHSNRNVDVSATLCNNINNAEDVPSLRTKLENDIQALEWNTFASSNSPWAPAASNPSASSLRSGTAALAARIANSVDCTLDPGTPRYLASAMEDSYTTQCRLIVTAEPPFRVVYASPAFESLTGITRGHTEGRPALSVLLSVKSTQLEGVDHLIESLHMHCRGCATVACRVSGDGKGAGVDSFPAKVTVSPLIDGNGDISHMLCTVRTL